jgi:hypothetical protein
MGYLSICLICHVFTKHPKISPSESVRLSVMALWPTTEVWVRLADVEAAEGVTFSGAQLRAAGVSIDGIENGEVEHVVAA